jgi:glutathione peroxidase
MSKISDFSWNSIQGVPFDVNSIIGKKVMLVNVASECGLTPQYKQLQELYDKYADSNFEILAFPCNDFAGQEPGTAEEISAFCETNYGVRFPIMEKIAIKGENTHPLYTWLCTKMQVEVDWNFQKFLIDEAGNVLESIPPQVLPNDPHILNWIENKES